MISWGDAHRHSRALIAFVACALVVAAAPGEAQARRWHKRKAAAAAAAAAAAPAFDAEEMVSQADRPKDERACAAAYQSAQEREQAGHLREAKELLQTCAKSTCGSFLRHACTTRFAQVDSDIPSVIPVVTDEGGAPHVDIEVKVDGEVVTSQLDGHALPVDPGLHEFTFATNGKVFATQKIMIVQGQRNRPISASLRTGHRPSKQLKMDVASADKAAGGSKASSSESTSSGTAATLTEEAATPEQPHRKGASPVTWVLGGVGAAALGAGALMIYWGRKDNQGLTNCAVPMESNCPQSAVDHIKKMYLMGNVSLGVGVAALGAAYWVYAATRPGKEERATEEALRIDVIPTKSGGVAAVSGSF